MPLAAAFSDSGGSSVLRLKSTIQGLQQQLITAIHILLK